MKTSEYYKQLILLLQSGEKIFINCERKINESGEIKIPICENFGWNSVGALTLGKCGELYAEYILNCLNCATYESVVDDHGVDLIAEYNNSYFKIQVKTIRDNNYTFIREGNPVIDKDFYVFYNRVSDNGQPKAYFFPMNYVLGRINDSENKQYICFKYREYKDKASKPEFGISATQKLFDEHSDSVISMENVDYYCVADGWDIKSERFDKIIQMNQGVDRILT